MSRKRSIRGKSGILPNVISIKNESGCKAGDKCLFPHHKVDEQPHQKSQRKATFPNKEEKATTRMLWQLCKLYHNWVASRKTRMRWCLKEANSPGETRCKKVLGPIRRIRFTLSPLRPASMQEKKGPSLGKLTSQKSSSTKSPRNEI